MTPSNHTKPHNSTCAEKCSNEETYLKKSRQRKKILNGQNDPCQTSSFIQHILSEDSKTNVAVVDLFVAVKSAKDNLDFLVKKNDDVLKQMSTLKAESGVVMNEYRNLAQNMRSFLDELNDERAHAKMLEKCGYKQEMVGKVQEESICAPKISKASVECLDYMGPFLTNMPSGQPNISTALLGSFLASIVWLKKREITLPKSLADDKLGKPTLTDSTLQIINDFCEIFGSIDSDSDDGELSSEIEEPNSILFKVADITSLASETHESDSELEVYATPPPTPPRTPPALERAIFQLKPKLSVTCMGDLTKEKKRNVSTGTERVTHSVTTQVTEEITSMYKKPKKKAKASEQNLEKSRDDVGLKVDTDQPTKSAGVHKDEDSEVSQPHSSDSLDSFLPFDSDDQETKSKSLSSSEEMEEFLEATNSKVCSTSDPPSLEKDSTIITTYKNPKPAFFEVWKHQPKPFIQEIISRSVKVRQSWEVENYKKQEEHQFVALSPGEKQEKEILIETSSVDLVVYIQVEVEEDQSEQAVFDVKNNTLGTQTSSHNNVRLIGLEEEKWARSHELEKGDKVEVNEKTIEKEREKKTVTFGEEVSEIIIEKEIIPEPEKVRKELTILLSMKEPLLTAEEFFELQELHSKFEICSPEPFYRAVKNVELDKALDLIREIESDVVDTKLSDAISILPRLESELRKHIKSKVKLLEEVEQEKSLDAFFSAFDIWPAEVIDDAGSGSSAERLDNLLTLVRDLEKAVKTNECGYNSSKIYGLLHALTESIRELEECSNVTSLSQTLDIASQLDTAVRECEGVVKRYPMENMALVSAMKHGLKSQSSEELSERGELNNVRKKVFQMVEEEAVDTEARLEKDTEKLDRLERENDEAMKFVEAFLQKTQRRASELTNIKTELQELSVNLKELYDELEKTENSAKEKTSAKTLASESINEKATQGAEEATEPVTETVSCLLLALDNLKSKAKKKKEFCREILSHSGIEKEIKDHDPSTRSSRSSFTAKNVEDLYSWVKDFKKIGEHSLYMSWTKPEGSLADSIVGYEIFVNGKLNQKVRNPQRLQAVLYSIDLSKKAEVLLYGLLDNGLKIFLSSVTYVK